MVLQISSYGDNGVVVTMNPVIFLGAAVFSLLTVFISIRKPAKIATKVSPIEAVRYTDGGAAEKEKTKEDDRWWETWKNGTF